MAEYHTHSDYESSIRTLSRNIDVLESNIETVARDLSSSISSLSSDISSLSSDVRSVERSLSTVRQEVDRVESRVISVESDVSMMEAQIVRLDQSVDTIGEYVNDYGGQVSDIAGAVESGSDQLGTMSEALRREVDREKGDRQQVKASFGALQAQQESLTKVLKEGLEGALSELQSLREKEAALQQQITAVSESFSQRLREMEEQAERQIGDIGEKVEEMDREEEEGREEMVEAFGRLVENDQTLGAGFSGVRDLAESIARDMGAIAREEEKAEQAREEDVAVKMNTLGLKFLSGGQGKMAQGSFRRAMELAPEKLEPRLNLAVSLLGNGGVDEARELSSALLADFPEEPNVRFLASLLALHDCDWDEASGHCHPDDEDEGRAASLTVGALAHLLSGRSEAARELFGKACLVPDAVGEAAKSMGFVPPEADAGLHERDGGPAIAEESLG